MNDFIVISKKRAILSNASSIGASFAFENPFTSSMIGAGAEFSFNSELDNSISLFGGAKSYKQFGIELGISTMFGIISHVGGNYLKPKTGEFSSSFISGYFGNYLTNKSLGMIQKKNDNER